MRIPEIIRSPNVAIAHLLLKLALPVLRKCINKISYASTLQRLRSLCGNGTDIIHTFRLLIIIFSNCFLKNAQPGLTHHELR